MGESKRRKEHDPFYGKISKGGRGIVLAGNLKVDESGALTSSPGLPKDHLRHALLYWDQIAWPESSSVSIPGGADEDFLMAEGKLFRPVIHGWESGRAGHSYMRLLYQSYRNLEGERPGAWTMGEGITPYLKEVSPVDEYRGMHLQLFRSIPVPDVTVPLEEVLRFKEKRHEELVLLQLAVEDIYLKIINSEDVTFAFAHGQKEVEIRAADAIRVARESGHPFRLSDWKLDFSFNVGSVAACVPYAAEGEKIGLSVGLPIVGGLIGGALPFLGVARSWGLKDRTKDRPFQYVTRMHNELLGPPPQGA